MDTHHYFININVWKRTANKCLPIMCSIHSSKMIMYHLLSENKVSTQYTLESIKVLRFEDGTPEECHNYTITPDDVCELMKNTTEFGVRLSLSSTDQLRINSSLGSATVAIEDSQEPECREWFVQILFFMPKPQVSNDVLNHT